MRTYAMIRAINGAARANTPKEVKIRQAQRDFKDHFQDSVDFEDSTLVDGKLQPLVVSRNKSIVTEKKIWAYPGDTIPLGAVVDCYDCKWLVTEIEPNNEIFLSGKMEQCNREISWQNKHTGEIVTRWATMSKPYFSNRGQTLDLGYYSKREYKVQMPFDFETELLDIDQRFMLEVIDGEPKTYKVVSVDPNTKRYMLHGRLQGFLLLNIQQDQYNPATDNRELMICDYFDPIDPPEDVGDDALRVEIQYSGSPVLRAGGAGKSFDAKVFDSNGDPVDTEVVWNLDMLDVLRPYIEEAVVGNHLTLRTAMSALVEGAVVKITAAVPESTYTSSVECEVVALV